MIDHPPIIGTVVTGEARGRTIGFPTLNLSLQSQCTLLPGVYAVWAVLDDQQKYMAIMHYGPRPTVQALPSCEVHIIDTILDDTPNSVTVEPIAKLREIQSFNNLDELVEQLPKDISAAKNALVEHDSEA